ncbi:hypothetical protein KCP74_03685 [Salmonella enterica subsp. enterica]|nr:hypothetical protein KCP74_03685 [Salmonella enterica subsp. enterica]
MLIKTTGDYAALCIAHSSQRANQFASRSFMVAIRRAILLLRGGRQSCRAVDLRRRDQLTFKGCSFDLKFCIRFRELFEQTSSSARVPYEYAIRSTNNAPSALELSTFQRRGAAGRYEQHRMYWPPASRPASLRSSAGFIYSYATGIRNAFRQTARLLATSLTSATIACLS